MPKMSKPEEIGSKQGLKTLQSNNKPNEAGKIKKSLLDYFPPSDNDNKKKVSNKSTQVTSTWITEEDLSSDVPGENFWEKVAEKRRLALEETLAENEKLCKQYEELTIENKRYEALLQEANTFVDVFKELVQNNADDTGIDVADLSTSTEIDE